MRQLCNETGGLTGVFALVLLLVGDTGAQSTNVRVIDSLKRQDLRGMVSGSVSPDGRYVYMASYRGFIHVLRRDLESARLKVTQTTSGRPNHQGTTGVQVSPNGRFVVTTAEMAGAVTLFNRDSESGGFKSFKAAHRRDGGRLASWQPWESVFSPDSEFVYTADRRGGVHGFRISRDGALKPVQTLASPEAPLAGVNGLAMHPDGETLFAIAPDDGSLLAMDRSPQTGELKLRSVLTDQESSQRGLSSAVDIALSSDGWFLYVSSGNVLGDYGISVFRLTSGGRLGLIQEYFDGEERLRDASSGHDIAVGPRGDCVYVCSKHNDRIVRLKRDPGSGRLSQPEAVLVGDGAPRGITALAVMPDGRNLYVGSERGETIWTLAAGQGEAADTAGKTVPMPAAGGASIPQIPASDAKTQPPLGQEELARMSGHQEHVIDVAFAPEGRWAVSASWDGTLRTWDVASGAQIRKIPVSWQQLQALACSPDGRLVASGGVDNLIRLWDSQTGEEVRQLRGSTGFVRGLAFSPDGKRLLSAAGDRKVRLWDVATGEELRIYEQRMEFLSSVSFSPSGKQALCSGGYYNNSKAELGEMLRVWDLDSGEVVFRLKPKVRSLIHKARFSPDGRRVAAVDLDAHGLGIWDLSSAERVHLLKPPGSIQDLAFTPCGRFILSGAADNTLNLNEIESGRKVREYRGHTGPVQAVAISPDGQKAISGSWDKTVRVWQLPEVVGSARPPASSRRSDESPAQSTTPRPVQEAVPVKPQAQIEPSNSSSATPAVPTAPVARAVLANPEEVAQALTMFSRGQTDLLNLSTLLRSFRDDEAKQKVKFLADLSQANQAVERGAKQLSEIELAARTTFQRRFANLPLARQAVWRVALPHKPLATEVPDGPAVLQEKEKTVVRKESRTTQQVYLDHALVEGAALKVRLSFPPREQRTGSLYTGFGIFIGIRDEKGQQQDLFTLPSTLDPTEVHEILLERHKDQFIGMYKDRARGTSPGLNRFQTSPYLYVALTGPAELIVHSLHIAPPASKPAE